MNKSDKSWEPIKSYLYSREMLELRDNILPNISYQPDKENIFRVFEMPLNKIKVVILGMDPYPQPNIANGYAFAVDFNQLKIPSSLKVIGEEVKNCYHPYNTDYDFPPEEWKELRHWRNNGVFLLNSSLTVETSRPGSHSKYWKPFIIKTIKYISINNPCVWILMGSQAKSFQTFIYNKVGVKDYSNKDLKSIPCTGDENYVIKIPHPASESYKKKSGFIGSDCFIRANILLKVKQQELINW